jgi:hypothetical protein
MSREDVWPTWLKKYVPRDLKNYTVRLSIIKSDRTLENEDKTVDGDPRSRRVKLICERCNNNWMSRLQEWAKPILLPLILGEKIVLSRDAQRIVAGWCAMSVMTADFFFPDRHAVPQTHRDHLRDRCEAPPDTWKIWIGNYKREKWKAHWAKQSMPISSKEHIPEITAGGFPRPNTQATTLVFGQLYVHVFSSLFPIMVAKTSITGKGIEKVAQIWPIREDFVAWPFNPMSDRDADNIAAAIFKMLDRIGADIDTSERERVSHNGFYTADATP